ncbi:hypothetical protein [Stenotrophomonas sp. ZAC14A_NAIMI4_1]|uniref:hypothetical protein n=1 Tax=Stenotrophomonas sp. ZAC14A_NAIMI4_1 TaxID=2072412 RepID=UPI00131ED630|nr:hypothetical protein [Stenotrophomonas sp. ZAC14A_NAIMI4_1]
MRLFGVDPSEFAQFKAAIESRLGMLTSSQASVESRLVGIEVKTNAILGTQIPTLEARIVQTAAESASDALAALNSTKERSAEIEELAREMHEAYAQIVNARKELSAAMESVSSSKDKFLKNSEELTSRSSESLRLHEAIANAESGAMDATKSIQELLTKTREILQTTDSVPAELEGIRKLSTDAAAQNENIKSLLSHSLRRKGEMDELHRQIFGHEIKDEAGNIERVDGLKDGLSKAYDALSLRISSLNEEANSAIESVDVSHAEFRKSQTAEFTTILESGKSSIESVSDQLKALLPGGLAAGLSAAYENKKGEEEKFLQSHERNFNYAVLLLVGISVIPFAINSYLLLHGSELTAVLKETPRLVLSILPLYFPVLWLAYSANKRLNLSKRLIEEYTHKAVLGKTFSGLSNQIESLSNEGTVKDELRTRLLFNVLQVSAENPGKLITDYSKADHPLMDVLEKSARLSESVEALSRVPGLGSIAKILSTRRDTMIREQEEKIDDGIVINEEIAPKPTNEIS